MAAGMRRSLLFITQFPVKNIHTHGNPLLIQATPVFWSDPSRKRKIIDPNAIKKREEKRIRRLEKGIRRLERADRVLKPVQEITVSPRFLNELETRRRPNVEMSTDEHMYREKLKRRWADYKLEQFAQDAKLMTRLIASQEKALKELREESEELYQAAIEVDPLVEGFEFSGPAFTPPVPGYNPPDGEYVTIETKLKM